MMTYRLAAVLAVACALGAPALARAAAEREMAESEADRPDWIKKPRVEDLLAVWPEKALREGKGGRAVIGCQVNLAGALFDCVVVAETPPGSGFGAAAIALAAQFLLKPGLKDGKPVVSYIQIPIRFADFDQSTGSHLKSQGIMAPITTKVVANVPWLEAPTYAQVLAAYPEKARQAKVGGHAVYNCTFKADGHLFGCGLVVEEPRGYDFSKAARNLMPSFVGPQSLPGGQKLKGVDVQIPVTFDPRMLQAAQPVIGKPQWTALPLATDVAAGYPKVATEAGITKARAVLNCAVVVDGALAGCVVASEDPAKLGFGAAALALSSSFRLSVWTPEGMPTIGGRVNIPIRYDMPAAAPANP